MTSEVTIIVEQPEVQIFATQGLPGPPGPAGGASDSIVILETDSTLVPGTPLYITAGAHFEIAQATGQPQTKVVGISTTNTGAGNAATAQTQDILTLTTVEWDAVTGDTGGLTPGSVYYLSLTLGLITKTPVIPLAPNVRFNSRIGIAISDSKMNLLIRSPIKL